MKVALCSDWHIGLTSPQTIRKLLKKLYAEKPDLIIHAGDYCGGLNGPKSVNTIMRFTRELCPDIPVVATKGNHDLWAKLPTLQSFWEAYGPYSLTAKYMKRWDIHFLDEDGPYVHTDFPHVGFVGGMGWYYSPDVSNNKKYICQDILGDTQRFLCRDFEDKSLKYLDELAENPIVTTKVFVSHFPIIEPNEDDLKWGGNFKFGEFIQKEYGIDYFFNGHMHANNNGPVRFEAGSDYGKPKYKIIEV